MGKSARSSFQFSILESMFQGGQCHRDAIDQRHSNLFRTLPFNTNAMHGHGAGLDAQRETIASNHNNGDMKMLEVNRTIQGAKHE
jgi:hypothetical protein